MDIDNEKFKLLLKSYGNADQYFFPHEISSWKDAKDGKEYSVDEGFKTQPHIGGIRIHEWDRTGNNPSIEEECQYDLSKAVGTVRELRKDQEFKNLIISDEYVKAKQNANDKGKRAKLGLLIPADNKYANDIVASKYCYLNLRKVINKSGFKIEHPEEKFDPSSGMNGLHAWAESVKLKRKKPLWLLLLPLLLLLFLLIPKCEKKELFDMEINTKSFIFVIDKSSSMQPTINGAQKEVDRLLKVLLDKRGIFSTYYTNIISYNDTAESSLGKIEELNDDTALKLNDYLKNLQADGGTRLESAIEKAAQEVAEHKKPTTLLIVTDAGDGSIGKMVNSIENIRKKFGDVEIYVNSTTPRALNEKDNIPKGGNETNLKRFSELLNGKFGNSGEMK